MDFEFAWTLVVIPVFLGFAAWSAWAAGTGRLKRNLWIGYKAPWLNESDWAWREGHRAATRISIIAAIFVTICSGVEALLWAFGVSPQELIGVLFVVTLVCVGSPAAVASRAAYRAESVR